MMGFPATRPWLAPAGALLASAAMLASAWGFQLLGGLQPCALCLYQRWPYWIVLGLAAVTLILGKRLGRSGYAALMVAAAATFLAGAGIAGFHTGVEQHWWPGLQSCGGAIHPGASLDDLKRQLLAAPVVRCDEVPWSLFGISLAGYNFLASLIFAGASVWATRKLLG